MTDDELLRFIGRRDWPEQPVVTSGFWRGLKIVLVGVLPLWILLLWMVYR